MGYEEHAQQNQTSYQHAAAEETEHPGTKRSWEPEEDTDEEEEQIWAERKKYWQKPVSKGPRGASASGREASRFFLCPTHIGDVENLQIWTVTLW